MNLSEFYQDKNRTSSFMDPDYGGPHWGQDFNSRSRLPEGTSIPALSGGTVVRNGWQDGHGWYLSHTADEPGWYWTYSHRQSRGGPGVGQQVAKNQSVGALGNTGLSTAPHLHVQYTQNPDPWKNGTGVAVDPWPKIVASLASWAGRMDDMPLNKDDEARIYRVTADVMADAIANESIVKKAYREILGREADDSGLRYWALKMAPRGEAWLRDQLRAAKNSGQK